MIISHKHKFIFIKTKKTAGTSLEIALSQFCGPEDVITPIAPEDEKIRAEMGFRGPQNFHLTWGHSLLSQKKRFYNHAPASFVRRMVGRKRWRDYFTFCFERNPFDKAVSRYYWSTRHKNPRPEFSEYLKTAPRGALSNWKKYTVCNRIIVDYVGKFENLSDELSFLADRFELPSQLVLPRSKSGYRPVKQSCREIFTDSDRRLVESICSNEIKLFEYFWSDQ